MFDTMIASAWLGRAVSDRRARRTAALERLVAHTQVSPPLPEVIAAYVELRTWCVRNGHGLGAKDHEADRWVAATALAGDLPLATDDGIFDHVEGLKRLRP